MRRFLYPKLSWRDAGQIFLMGVVGALVAGIYGVIHDQVTYSLSPEYFSKFKAVQFKDYDYGWPVRGFVALIGFLATWWVGLILGWFLARMSLAKLGRVMSWREFWPRIGAIFAIMIVCEVAGYVYGTLRYEASLVLWSDWQRVYGIVDVAAFARVGHIHNMAYLGGVFGTVMVSVFGFQKIVLLLPYWRVKRAHYSVF